MNTRVSLVIALVLTALASRVFLSSAYEQLSTSANPKTQAKPKTQPLGSASIGGVKVGMDTSQVGRMFDSFYGPPNGWRWFGGTHEHRHMVRVLFKDNKVHCVVGRELQIDSKDLSLVIDRLWENFGKDFVLRHDKMGESYLCYDQINMAFRIERSGSRVEEAMIGSSDVDLFVQSGQHNVTLP